MRRFSSDRIMLRRQTGPVCPATTSRSALLETVTAAGFALIIALPASHAAEDCASIRDPDQRLACYDRSFPPSPAEPSSAEAEDTSNQTDQGLSDEPVAPASADAGSGAVATSDQNATSSTATTASTSRPDETATDTNNKESGGWFSGLFSSKDQAATESSIVALRRRETQNLIFLLANDEIWLQDAPRANDPFRVGDRVSIKRGSIGGWFLTSEDGASTRVRRIK